MSNSESWEKGGRGKAVAMCFDPQKWVVFFHAEDNDLWAMRGVIYVLYECGDIEMQCESYDGCIDPAGRKDEFLCTVPTHRAHTADEAEEYARNVWEEDIQRRLALCEKEKQSKAPGMPKSRTPIRTT